MKEGRIIKALKSIFRSVSRTLSNVKANETLVLTILHLFVIYFQDKASVTIVHNK